MTAGYRFSAALVAAMVCIGACGGAAVQRRVPRSGPGVRRAQRAAGDLPGQQRSPGLRVRGRAGDQRGAGQRARRRAPARGRRDRGGGRAADHHARGRAALLRHRPGRPGAALHPPRRAGAGRHAAGRRALPGHARRAGAPRPPSAPRHPRRAGRTARAAPSASPGGGSPRRPACTSGAPRDAASSAGSGAPGNAPDTAHAPGAARAAGDHARRVVRVRHPVQQLRDQRSARASGGVPVPRAAPRGERGARHPSARAGMQRGDRLTHVDGVRLPRRRDGRASGPFSPASRCGGRTPATAAPTTPR